MYWYHGPGRTKLNSKWVGPYRVIGTHSSKVMLSIENPLTRQQHYVHANALRLANVRPKALQVHDIQDHGNPTVSPSNPAPTSLGHAPLLQPLNVIVNDEPVITTTVTRRPTPHSDTTHSEDLGDMSISSNISEVDAAEPEKAASVSSNAIVTNDSRSLPTNKPTTSHGANEAFDASQCEEYQGDQPEDQRQARVLPLQDTGNIDDNKTITMNDDDGSQLPRDQDKCLGTHFVMTDGKLQRRSTRLRKPPVRYASGASQEQSSPSRKRKRPQQARQRKRARRGT